MPPIDLVDRLLEGVLRIEDDHVGVPEEIPVRVDLVDLVDVELAVACEDEGFTVLFYPVTEGPAGVRIRLLMIVTLLRWNGDSFSRMKKLLRGEHRIEVHREVREDLLVFNALTDVSERRIDVETVSLHEEGHEERDALYVIPVRMGKQDIRDSLAAAEIPFISSAER